MAKLDKVRQELDQVHRELEDLAQRRRAEPLTTDQLKHVEQLQGYEQLLRASVENTGSGEG